MLYLSGVVRTGLPVMLSMGMGNRAPATGPWAADSGRFNKPETYTDEKYLAFLTRHQWAVDRCLFATAPDVMGDAEATWELSEPMFERIRGLGYPAALVAQDGLWEPDWSRFDALFVGGTTEFKLSPEARALCHEAKRRGKWVHMGRVNSLKRMLIAKDFHCDSVDGTAIAYNVKRNERQIHEWLQQVERVEALW